jgi:D-lyxose ketol-isomerase
MSESYRAILVDGHLHWLNDVPDAIQRGTGELRVRVMIEEADEQDEEELGTLLDELAEADPYSHIEDPVEWQRELRGERDLE